MATIDSARALGLDVEIGSLEVGKRADVILVHLCEPHIYPFHMPLHRTSTPRTATTSTRSSWTAEFWSRSNQERLRYQVQVQPVLAATSVSLSVLAPVSYYRGYDLTTLSSTLNSGLGEFGERKAVSLDFEFCQLGTDYAANSTSGRVRSAIGNRYPIWSAE